MKEGIKLIVAVVLIFVMEVFLYPITDKTHYYQGFNKPYEIALKTKGEERIILLGGSSLGWGVSAESIQKETGIIALNFGVHANTGYRGSFGLIEEVLTKKDLIIISPEWEKLAGSFASLYDSKRSEEYCYIKNFVKREFDINCIGFVLNRVLTFQDINPNRGDYKYSSFNANGDVVHGSKSLEMPFIEWTEQCVYEFDSKNYINFFNKLRNEGYKILYIPTLIPESLCSDISKRLKINGLLSKQFGTLIDEELKLKDEYFYDTQYHLTKEGVDIKTEKFLKHIKNYLAKPVTEDVNKMLDG